MRKIKNVVFPFAIILVCLCQSSFANTSVITNNATSLTTIAKSQSNNDKRADNSEHRSNIFNKIDELDKELKNISYFEINWEMCNLSHYDDEDYLNDIFLAISVDTGWYKTDYTNFRVYESIPDDGYRLILSKDIRNPVYRLLDLNGDSVSEIILEETFLGQHTDTHVEVFTRKGDSFGLIFNEGIAEILPFRPYYYLNEYEFVKNDVSGWYDIELNSIIYSDNLNRGIEFASEIEHGKTTYRFNGEEYISIGNAFDYRMNPEQR